MVPPIPGVNVKVPFWGKNMENKSFLLFFVIFMKKYKCIKIVLKCVRRAQYTKAGSKRRDDAPSEPERKDSDPVMFVPCALQICMNYGPCTGACTIAEMGSKFLSRKLKVGKTQKVN